MRRRLRGMLAASVLALVACVAPGSSGGGSPTATGAPTTSGQSAGCEYIGARFSPPTAFAVEEHRDPSVAVPRISLRRDASSRGVLVSIIPRTVTTATVTSA